MTKHVALAFAALLAVPAFSQQTGVSNPPDSSVQDIPMAASTEHAAPVPSTVPVKPSAATPEVYGEYKPYNPNAVTLQKAQMSESDPDAGIVTDVPRHANELPAGTQIHIRLNSGIDTNTSQEGTAFTAQVVDNVMTDGRVVIPAASSVEGRITQLRGGKRIHGTALIHLQIDDVLMPDGTRLPLRAQVIDTDQFANTRIDDEGNILRKDHIGGTLTAMSLTTGGAAAAGGVLGGPAGALIGAGVGAGLSTTVWLKQDRQAHLPEGTQVVLGLTQPLDLAHADFTSGPMLRREAVPSPSAAVTVAPAQTNATPYVTPQAFVPTN